MSEPKPASAPSKQPDAEFATAVEAGLESLKAGRRIAYEDVRRWLLSWGADKELPAPKCK